MFLEGPQPRRRRGCLFRLGSTLNHPPLQLAHLLHLPLLPHPSSSHLPPDFEADSAEPTKPVLRQRVYFAATLAEKSFQRVHPFCSVAYYYNSLMLLPLIGYN